MDTEKLVGFTKTEDMQVTTTILGEEEGMRISIQKQVSRTALPTQPAEGTTTVCLRCFTDTKTGVFTCVPIKCP
jgi:hypothetical protein